MTALDGLVAVVPAKSFVRAKTRLAAHLDPRARGELAERMLRHVLAVLTEAGVFDTLWVLTDDAGVGAVARQHSCRVAFDRRTGLDAVIDDGLAQAQREGATAALVCMADLPRLEATEAREAARALACHEVVLAGDARGRGTNLLGLRPPGRMPSCFGRRDSLMSHVDAAARLGLSCRTLSLAGFHHDLDLPEDLEALSLLRSP